MKQQRSKWRKAPSEHSSPGCDRIEPGESHQARMGRERRWTFLFFFNYTATTEIYTLSLHDALPIFIQFDMMALIQLWRRNSVAGNELYEDRKSTRLNSSHLVISYAVFCLKKKH